MPRLVEELLSKNKRAAARLITLIENEDEQKKELLKQIYPHTGQAFVVGITGSPGAGKSSLVNRLVSEVRLAGLTCGVIAIDPTSPFSGGAILGDRIRMQEHALDEGVFIRSMGTRGSLGGLSRATAEAVQVLDAFGKDVIIVETVGVGQSEVDIVKTADSTVVVLTPAMGDSVQTIKAGIMEIADIFVINKADLPGAERTEAEIGLMLDLSGPKKWRPPVVPTQSLTGEGAALLWQELENHQEYLSLSGKKKEVRLKRVRQELTEQVEHLVKTKIWRDLRDKTEFESLVEKISRREEDPYSAAGALLEMINFKYR